MGRLGGGAKPWIDYVQTAVGGGESLTEPDPLQITRCRLPS